MCASSASGANMSPTRDVSGAPVVNEDLQKLLGQLIFTLEEGPDDSLPVVLTLSPELAKGSQPQADGLQMKMAVFGTPFVGEPTQSPVSATVEPAPATPAAPQIAKKELLPPSEKSENVAVPTPSIAPAPAAAPQVAKKGLPAQEEALQFLQNRSWGTKRLEVRGPANQTYIFQQKDGTLNIEIQGTGKFLEIPLRGTTDQSISKQFLLAIKQLMQQDAKPSSKPAETASAPVSSKEELKAQDEVAKPESKRALRALKKFFSSSLKEGARDVFIAIAMGMGVHKVFSREKPTAKLSESQETQAVYSTLELAEIKKVQNMLGLDLKDNIPKQIQDLTSVAMKRLALTEQPKDMTDEVWQRLQVIRAAKSNGDYPPQWIDALFGKSEKEIVNELKYAMRNFNLASPQSVSMQTLARASEGYERETQERSPRGEYHKDAHTHSEDAPGGAQLAASQFDGLESPYANERTDVTSYRGDRTQGPAVVMAAAAATLWRKAAVELNEEDATKGLPHALKDCFDGIPQPLLDKLKNDPSWYKNGYLQLHVLDEKEQQILLTHLEQNIHKLRILPASVQCQNTGKYQLQILAAAPSYQNMVIIHPKTKEKTYGPEVDVPKAGSPGDKICRLLVKAQYEAAARIAVIRSKETGEPFRLDLSLVGQGAFKNRPEVMIEAMKAVNNVVKGHDVDVVWQFWNAGDIEKMINGASKEDLETVKQLVLPVINKGIGIEKYADFQSESTENLKGYIKNATNKMKAIELTLRVGEPLTADDRQKYREYKELVSDLGEFIKLRELKARLEPETKTS